MVPFFVSKQNSSTYWEGNCEAESLQRVYGISFPNDKQVSKADKIELKLSAYEIITAFQYMLTLGARGFLREEL